MPIPNGTNAAIAIAGVGARPTPRRPMPAITAAAQMTGLRPTRSEIRAPGIAAIAVITPTMAVPMKTVVLASASLMPWTRWKYGRASDVAAYAPRKRSRTTRSHSTLDSRRMSVDHAERATPSHDCVRRGAAVPSRTVVTSTIIVTSSTTPSAIVARKRLPVFTPKLAIPTPAIVPRTIIVPISPLARPTWRFGTRSGT